MPRIALSGVGHSFGDRTLFHTVNFSLEPGQKAALVGANGSGKTTLLRILAGQLSPDRGKVVLGRETQLAYLPQEGMPQGEVHQEKVSQDGVLQERPQSGGCTLYREVEKAFAGARRMIQQMEELAQKIGQATDRAAGSKGLLIRYQELQERILASGYYERKGKIQRVLTGLGFRPEDFTAEAATFSSGWQMRIALAKILCQAADILLLDEPTNYLDLAARNWLEGFLKAFPGGILLVSHDRYFLDVTVNTVVELYQGRLRRYPGNFSNYETRRAEELTQITAAYQKQQEELRRIQSFIRRFRYNASKARLVQSRIRQLERMERIEPPPVMKSLHFHLPQASHSGRRTLFLEKVSKRYGERTVLQSIDLELSRGERLVVLGANGAGKSTLLRLMAGVEQPTDGMIGYGQGVRPAYYAASSAYAANAASSAYPTLPADEASVAPSAYTTLATGQAKVTNSPQAALAVSETKVTNSPRAASSDISESAPAGVHPGGDSPLQPGAGRKQEGTAGPLEGHPESNAERSSPGSSASSPPDIIEQVNAWAPDRGLPELRDLLGAFLFRGDDIYKSVDILSGGEKSRLALLRLLLSPNNLLLLDEPTNHLDLTSKAVLLEALSKYRGTLVFVSHDRYFIDRLATGVLELQEGRGRYFPGDYAYYLWFQTREQETASGPEGVGRRPATNRSPSKEARLEARLKEKQLKSTARRLAREERRIVERLEALAQEARMIEQSMTREEVYLDGRRMKEAKNKLAQNARQQQTLLERWEALDQEQRSLQEQEARVAPIRGRKIP